MKAVKLFVITPQNIYWDECDGQVILAETKERAIKIAQEQHDNFRSIDTVEEIDTSKEGFVFESINWG